MAASSCNSPRSLLHGHLSPLTTFMPFTSNPPPPRTPASTTSLYPLNGTCTDSQSSHPPLPRLPYSLRDHWRSITLIWTLLTLESAILPIILFYTLWYSSDLVPAYIFAITGSGLGLVSGCEWVYRSWQLWKKEKVRPLGGSRIGVSTGCAS